MKRILQLMILLAVMCALLTPWASAVSAEDVASGTFGTNQSWSWSYDGAGHLTVTGTGAMPNNSPWGSYSNYITSVTVSEGATSIGDYAFNRHKNLAEASLPSTLTSIGKNAFSETKLTSVNLPAGVQTIGEQAFNRCSLTAIVLPESLQSIGYSAFRKTGLKTLQIPDAVQFIDTYAFAECASLETVEIGDGLERLETAVFSECTMLTSISFGTGFREFAAKADAFLVLSPLQGCSNLRTLSVDPDNPYLISDSDGFIFTKDGKTLVKVPGVFPYGDYEIPAGVTAIGPAAFAEASGLGTLTLPATLKSVGVGAFAECEDLSTVHVCCEDAVFERGVFFRCGKLTSVDFSDGVTALGQSMFAYSGLIHIRIPGSVKTVGSGCFSDCYSLASVELEEGITTLENGVFASCYDLQWVELPSTVTEIPDSLFNECYALSSVTIRGPITAIGDSAFSSTALSSIELPETLTSIGSMAFDEVTELTSVYIPDSVTYIGGQAFGDCSSLRKVRLPAGMTEIPSWCFCGAGLTSLDLPDTVTKIGKMAFYDTNLTSVVVPASVTTIDGSGALAPDSLKSVYFMGAAPTLNKYNDGLPEKATLYYFAGQPGWTSPTWKGYTTKAIMTTAGEIDDETYYQKLNDYHFLFRDENGDALDGVSITFGDVTLPGQAGISEQGCSAAAGDWDYFTFHKEGYHTVELPALVLEGLSVIRLYPADYAAPFVQAIYGTRNDHPFVDLQQNPLTFSGGNLQEQTEFYAQVNWLGQEPDSLCLSATPDPDDALFTLPQGACTVVPVSAFLTADSALFLVAQRGSERWACELPVHVTQSSQTATLNTGEEVRFNTSHLDFLSKYDLKVKLTDKVSLTLHTETDGTFFGMIGIELASREKPSKPLQDTLEDHFRKLEMDFRNDTDSVLDLAKLMKKIKDGKYDFEAFNTGEGTFMIDCKCQLVGYLKGVFLYDESGEIVPEVTEGRLGLSLEGSLEKTWQMPVTATNPFYVGGKFDVKNESLISINDGRFAGPLEPVDVLNETEIGFKARGGWGWDKIASAGMYGQGVLKMDWDLPMDVDTVKVLGSAAIGAEAAFFCLERDLVIAEFKDVPLNAAAKQGNLMQIVDDSGWQAQSRDYLHTAALMEQSEEAVLMAESDLNVSFKNIRNNMYPYANVQLAQLTDRDQLVVWTDDDGTRSDYNRTTLYYSRCENGYWRGVVRLEPTDDGTADFNPLLTVLNGTPYLVWQNADRPIETADPIATAACMDLACARYDAAAKTWEILGDGFGTEGVYDGTMSLTLLDGQPAVYYTANATNDPISGAGANTTLHRAVWTGETWQEETLLENLGAVDHTAANGDTVWFTADTDLNGATWQDRELFVWDGSLRQLTNDDVMDSKPSYADGRLTWFSGDSMTDGTETVAMTADADRYQVLQSADVTYLVYTVTDSNRISRLYASFNDGSGWGEPLQLSDGRGCIRSFHAQCQSNGYLQVLVNEQSVTPSAEEIGFPTMGSADLRLYTVDVMGDLTISEVDYLPNTLGVNKDLTVTVELRNTGCITAELIHLTVSDAAGVLAETVVPTELLSGRSERFNLNVPMGNTVPETLTVTAMPVGFGDATANTAVLTLHRTDLSLEEAVAFADETSAQVTVMAANRGQTAIETAELILTDAEGNELATQTVTGVAAQSAAYVTFLLEQPLEGGALLHVTAPEVGTENLVSNNRISVLVPGKRAGTFTENLSVTQTGDAVKTTVSVKNGTAETVTGNYVCAAYDGAGKLLAQRTETNCAVAAGQTRFLTASFPADTALVKVFRLDPHWCPAEAPLIWEK